MNHRAMTWELVEIFYESSGAMGHRAWFLAILVKKHLLIVC